MVGVVTRRILQVDAVTRLIGTTTGKFTAEIGCGGCSSALGLGVTGRGFVARAVVCSGMARG